MTITYQLEPWPRYYGDPAREGLWRTHYAEFEPFHRGLLPFGPDVGMYEGLEARGALQIMVARSDGEMVGYCLVAIRRHPHYEIVCGFEDSYYVRSDFRRGMNGVKLIKRSRDALVQRGVSVSYWMTKEFNTIEAIFRHLGWRKCDTVFVTGLGG